MSNLKAAADEARKLVKMFKSVEIIAKTFDEIADIESLRAEVENRLADSQNLEAVELDRRKAIRAEANKILADAENQAEKIIMKAGDNVIEAGARVNELKKLHADLLDDVKHIKDLKSEVIKEREQMLRDIDEKISARNKDLYDIESKIVQAKEAINKMLTQ